MLLSQRPIFVNELRAGVCGPTRPPERRGAASGRPSAISLAVLVNVAGIRRGRMIFNTSGGAV
jgi:hypothetical protein